MTRRRTYQPALPGLGGYCEFPEGAARALLQASADVFSRWYSAVSGAIARERARQSLYREENNLKKSAKVDSMPLAPTDSETAIAAMSESVVRAMFGDDVANYAALSFKRAMRTGDKRAFKIRLLMLKARDSLSDIMHDEFARFADEYIEKAEKSAGCIPSPGPRRMSRAEKARKLKRDAMRGSFLEGFSDGCSDQSHNRSVTVTHQCACGDAGKTEREGSSANLATSTDSTPVTADAQANASAKESDDAVETTNATGSTDAHPVKALWKRTSTADMLQQEIATTSHDNIQSKASGNVGQDKITSEVNASSHTERNKPTSSNTSKTQSKKRRRTKSTDAILLMPIREGYPTVGTIISSISDVLGSETIEQMANRTKAAGSSDKRRDTENDRSVTVTQDKIQKSTPENQIIPNTDKPSTGVQSPLPCVKPNEFGAEENVVRKARKYMRPSEILEDVKAGKIVPYTTASDVVSAMKSGVLSPSESILYLSVLDSITGKSKKARGKSRRSKSEEFRYESEYEEEDSPYQESWGDDDEETEERLQEWNDDE